ncbi:hypothetical protein ABPG75_005498 [Micractinium tetrahymenae]
MSPEELVAMLLSERGAASLQARHQRDIARHQCDESAIRWLYSQSQPELVSMIEAAAAPDHLQRQAGKQELYKEIAAVARRPTVASQLLAYLRQPPTDGGTLRPPAEYSWETMIDLLPYMAQHDAVEELQFWAAQALLLLQGQPPTGRCASAS